MSVPVLSPCVKVCRYDPDIKMCRSCKRTLQEIGTWGRMSNDDRQAVMDTLADRTVPA